MEITEQTAMKLTALVIAVGRYTAEKQAGCEGNLNALRRVNDVAQLAAVDELRDLATEASNLVDSAYDLDDPLYWDKLIGKVDGDV